MLLRYIFKFYRFFISPFFQVGFQIQCRFNETCSQFTERAIAEKGLFKGTFMGLKRFVFCNKWIKNG